MGNGADRSIRADNTISSHGNVVLIDANGIAIVGFGSPNRTRSLYCRLFLIGCARPLALVSLEAVESPLMLSTEVSITLTKHCFQLLLFLVI